MRAVALIAVLEEDMLSYIEATWRMSSSQSRSLGLSIKDEARPLPKGIITKRRYILATLTESKKGYKELLVSTASIKGQ